MSRALFFGTPAIAVPALHALADLVTVVGVVCQPDRPAGRGLTPTVPAVKAAALARGFPVVQPTKLRTGEFAAWARNQCVDIAIVLAYGRILPADVLAAPRLGCINLHASLLPAYRGAAPIARAILEGKTETGMSLMQMDEGLDTGPVYQVRRLAIGTDETTDELTQRLGQLAAVLLSDSIVDLLQGNLFATPQTATQATYAPPLVKEAGSIVWRQRAQQIHNHVRGMQPWPGAFTRVSGKMLKVLRTRMAGDETFSAVLPSPGTLVIEEKRRVLVACADGFLEILTAQVEGKKALPASELVNGRIFASGVQLEEFPRFLHTDFFSFSVDVCDPCSCASPFFAHRRSVRRVLRSVRFFYRSLGPSYGLGSHTRDFHQSARSRGRERTTRSRSTHGATPRLDTALAPKTRPRTDRCRRTGTAGQTSKRTLTMGSRLLQNCSDEKLERFHGASPCCTVWLTCSLTIHKACRASASSCSHLNAYSHT